jgi:hypothetical protein
MFWAESHFWKMLWYVSAAEISIVKPILVYGIPPSQHMTDSIQMLNPTIIQLRNAVFHAPEPLV